MKYSKLIRFGLGAALVMGFSTAAFGQSTRTWVSGTGSDANPCSRTAPCQTFSGALSKTATGGEISALDPSGFGTININKAITINGTGTLASILASGVTGIIVNAPATDTVIIRDISINGATTGQHGVRYLAGKTLMLDHVWIYGFSGLATSRGIDASKSSDGQLKVIDSVIENILEDGMHLTTTVGGINVTVERTRIMNCGGDGFEAVANIRGAIRNSVINHNTSAGIKASGSNSLINIDDAYVSFSSVGLQSIAGSSLRVSDSIIAQNATGLNPNGGTIDSFQGNSLIGNTAPGAFSTTTAKQ
jgi:hypothetical protein